jgi:hypothetical protein
MKIKILRPIVIILPDKNVPMKCDLVIENITLLTAFWILNWYGKTFIDEFKIVTPNYDPRVIGRKSFFIPKFENKKDLIKYLVASFKIQRIISSCELDPNLSFGLLPMNTYVDVVARVHHAMLQYRDPKTQTEMFLKRNNRWEFPVTDFGYFQCAFEKAKDEWRKENMHPVHDVTKMIEHGVDPKRRILNE